MGAASVRVTRGRPVGRDARRSVCAIAARDSVPLRAQNAPILSHTKRFDATSRREDARQQLAVGPTDRLRPPKGPGELAMPVLCPHCVAPAAASGSGHCPPAAASACRLSSPESAAPTENPQRILRIRRNQPLQFMAADFVFCSAAASACRLSLPGLITSRCPSRCRSNSSCRTRRSRNHSRIRGSMDCPQNPECRSSRCRRSPASSRPDAP